MLPANLPLTYFQQSTSVEERQCVPPLNRVDQEHEPVMPPYHLTGLQLTPIMGTATVGTITKPLSYEVQK
jgi:hypothetical protein